MAKAKAKKDRILIFDTTLRDGEQCPGGSLNNKEKLEIARTLARLKVNIIEAGFPIASNDDFEAVRQIAHEVSGPTICGLARCVERDIVRAAEALKGATRPRIHVFIATSKIHLKYKLKKARQEILRQAVAGVELAKGFTNDVEFSPEDASRTEWPFLAEVVEAAIAAGATTVNIPDTVGYAVPEEFGATIRYLAEHVPNIKRAVISVHCHNDLGLAVANSLAGVINGARQVECTINGIGERAGNAALEEIVMAIRTRQDYFRRFTTGINAKHIHPASRMVSKLTGLVVQRNKAIVGDNAFAHEAGIHQHGMLANRSTYEIMKPEHVGLQHSKLVIGKHSGKAAVASRIKALGFHLSPKEIARATREIKDLADKKKVIYDADIEAIAHGLADEPPEIWRLESLHVATGNKITAVATVRLSNGDGPKRTEIEDAAIGDGPVNAVYTAIDRITKVSGALVDYRLDAVTRGREALGEVHVTVDFGGRQISGRGASTDIIEASARAYLAAVNRFLALDQADGRGPRHSKRRRKKTVRKKKNIRG